MDSKRYSTLNTEQLKKFPPDGCDHYAWLHYVLPLVEQFESLRAAAEEVVASFVALDDGSVPDFLMDALAEALDASSPAKRPT